MAKNGLNTVILVILLALLAHQTAQLIWGLTATPPKPATVALEAGDKTPWFSTLILRPAENQSTEQSNKSANSAVTSDIDGWVLKGIYAEDQDSVAIIQTGQKSYVLEVGESIENGFVVTAIAPRSITVTGPDGQPTKTLTLRDAQLSDLADEVQAAQPNAQGAYRPKPATDKGSVQPAWLTAIRFVPKVIDGQAAVQITATSTEGFSQLRHFGLRQGDILLSIDGMAPSPQMWRVAEAKWRMRQPLVAKIKRFQEIKTITLENKQ